MRYQLYREQQLDCSIEEAWDFFSSPNNLARITPSDMGFKVINSVEGDIRVGMQIDYVVSPLFKIPLKWKTRITEVVYQDRFVDFQEKGPYKLWNHLHEFTANDSGVLMKDTVQYELPFGMLGDWVHQLFVKKRLIDIFEYRRKVLDQMFNNSK